MSMAEFLFGFTVAIAVTASIQVFTLYVFVCVVVALLKKGKSRE